MDWTACDIVEIVPGKVSGVPILKHSRVPADTVLESSELGESVDEIAYSFDLVPEDIRAVLAFAASLNPPSGKSDLGAVEPNQYPPPNPANTP